MRNVKVDTLHVVQDENSLNPYFKFSAEIQQFIPTCHKHRPVKLKLAKQQE